MLDQELDGEVAVVARDDLRQVEAVRDSVLDCVGRTPMVSLRRMFPEPDVEVLAKLELMNPGGSMKDRSARFIVEGGLADGSLPPHAHLVESSSGNFGVAVAMVARLHGLRFTCVVDPRAAASNVTIMRGLGAEVDTVTEPDAAGGYLGTRISRVHELLATRPDTVWINQYANERNWLAHYHGTGAEIVDDLLHPPTALVGAVSTTGSLLGCSRRLRDAFGDLHVVAVDALGSVLFGGGPPGARDLPGIGSSRVPELQHRNEVDRVLHVDDHAAALAARELLRTEAIFAGGSSGSVLAAIRRLLPELPRPCRVVTLLPDRGDRYLDRIWNDEWLRHVCGDRGQCTEGGAAASII